MNMLVRRYKLSKPRGMPCVMLGIIIYALLVIAIILVIVQYLKNKYE